MTRFILTVMRFRLRQFLRRHLTQGGLYDLIPPEIKDDEFYRALSDIAARADVQTILEIGASAGEGSTEALVAGALRNPSTPQLHCLEVSTIRFRALAGRWAKYSWIACYNISSVEIKEFPSKEEVKRFYERHDSRLRHFSLEEVLGWLEQDIDYVRANNLDRAGIDNLKRDTGIGTFDAVLIDGSEFTGEAELQHVYGSKYLMLDDVQTFKNFNNYVRLSRDSRYRLIAENPSLRNGFAIFGVHNVSER